jgi:hypothetical protein
MSFARPVLAPGIVGRRNARAWRRRAERVQRKAFGRGPVRELAPPAPPKSGFSDDLKLFATTFAAGFLVVSILIA